MNLKLMCECLVWRRRLFAEFSDAEALTLTLLYLDGRKTVGDVTSATGTHPAHMTRICDALEDKGIIERRHDTVDRRKIWLTLTDDGVKQLNDAAKTLEQAS